jgi:hypothetical protein
MSKLVINEIKKRKERLKIMTGPEGRNAILHRI